MDSDANLNIKRQIVEKVASAKHILITIPKNPSVDEMSASVGLSLLLDKLDKRPSIVFSGKVPPAISFLEPDKLITQDIDGLRDFIIALDKDKADKLRWKLEDDIVKIFITPYKTPIVQDDLNFQQGEFNVEMVIALGIEKNDDLDQALQAQGKILHDATIVSINAGDVASSLGSINWQDKAAGSICEMLVAISEAFGNNLLDEQIATAFLTGIVAKTNRFSNELTTPKVMTMSAQLMAAGANQQLIASNLGNPEELDEGAEASIKDAISMPSTNNDETEMNVDHTESSKRDVVPSSVDAEQSSESEQVKPAEEEAVEEQVKSDVGDNNSSEVPASEGKSDDTDPHDSIENDKSSEVKPEINLETPQQPEASSEAAQEQLTVNDRPPQVADSDSVDGLVPSAETGMDQSNTQGKNEHADKAYQLTSSIQPSSVPETTKSTPELADSGELTKHRIKSQVVEPPQFGGTLNGAVADSSNELGSNYNPMLASNDEDRAGITKGIDPTIATKQSANQVDSQPLSVPTGDSILSEPQMSSANSTDLVMPSDSMSAASPVTDPVEDARQAVLDASHTVTGPQSSVATNSSQVPIPSSVASAPAAAPITSSLPPLPPLPADPNAPLPPLPDYADPSVMMPPIQPIQSQTIDPAMVNQAPSLPVATNQTSQASVDPGTFPLPPAQ